MEEGIGAGRTATGDPVDDHQIDAPVGVVIAPGDGAAARVETIEDPVGTGALFDELAVALVQVEGHGDAFMDGDGKIEVAVVVVVGPTEVTVPVLIGGQRGARNPDEVAGAIVAVEGGVRGARGVPIAAHDGEVEVAVAVIIPPGALDRS